MTKRILFVDDEPKVLHGLERMLQTLDTEWEMVFVEGGEEALAQMAQTPFDVIVSDMRMPGMNGAQLLREVMHRHPTTVRLVLSGHADKDLVSQCVGVAHQYISKPCNPEQLESMIGNAFLLSSELIDGEVKHIIGSTDKLPSVPSLYTKLRRALEDVNVNTQDVAAIISQDMAMTAKILKLVNSAFFGLRRTIETPLDAVSYLGIETIKNLVLANSIFESAPELKTRAFTIEELWQHSLTVAMGAKAIAGAENASQALQEEAFVGGILHDVGMLILSVNFPERYDLVADGVLTDHSEIPVAEKCQFGVTHAEVGAYLLGLWGLPASILTLVRMHHHPDVPRKNQFSSLLAVHAACTLSRQNSDNPFFRTGKVNEDIVSQAGLLSRLEVWRELVQNSRNL